MLVSSVETLWPVTMTPGVVVTGQRLDLTQPTGASFLGQSFLNMTDSQQGYDENITQVTLQNVETVIPDAIEKLGANKGSPFFSVKFPDSNDEFLITKPTYMEIGSPTGRSTGIFP